MLTMDTGKSSKGHGGHQKNIQLPETKGSLKAWIPCKAPNPSRQGEQGLSLFPTTWQEPRGEEIKDAD